VFLGDETYFPDSDSPEINHDSLSPTAKKTEKLNKSVLIYTIYNLDSAYTHF